MSWVGLTLVSLASFWTQATVTEERLVPALNVIAEYYGMSDDIAGATLMAAGASSPELFSSIVALFVTHSSIGLGTIVGSEIFNQLVICAGAVYASKTGKLALNRTTVAREVGFYALAILLLYLALRDVGPVEGDDVDHIFISFAEACMVFGGYIAYVLVCANMEAIVRLLSKKKDASLSGEDITSYGTCEPPTALAPPTTVVQQIKVPDYPFVTEKKHLSSDPASNWAPVSYYRSKSVVGDGLNESASSAGARSVPRRGSSFLASSIRDATTYRRRSTLVDLFQHSECPSAMHDLYDMDHGLQLSCFLWQKSFFYTKAHLGAHAWHLRWFTLGAGKVTSVPDRQDAEIHGMTYPHFQKIVVDEDRLIVEIINPNPKKRNYTLMAPSPEIFHEVIQEFEDYMRFHSKGGDNVVYEEDEPDAAVDADHHMSLIEFPSDGSNMEIVFWILLCPLRFAMHYTVPDVRHLDEHGNSKATIGLAYFSTMMCLVWLIIGSLAMVSSLEALAELMDIPDAVVGLTVSAAGTSLPNYVAAKVAAENGFGNQAVSSAFGANTFNIMIGLGLPWVLYTSFGTGFEPYSGLRNEDILESIIIMAVVLLVFIVLMFQSGFVLYKWHGHLFIFLYIAFLALEIGQVYLGGNGNQ